MAGFIILYWQQMHIKSHVSTKQKNNYEALLATLGSQFLFHGSNAWQFIPTSEAEHGVALLYAIALCGGELILPKFYAAK